MNKTFKIFLGALFLVMFWQITGAKAQGVSPINIFKTQSILSHNTDISESKTSASIYSFNGIDSYLEVSQSFDSTFSFCAWIKPTDLLKKNMAIVGIPGAFWLRTTSNRELQFTQPGINDNNTEGLLLSNQNWIFVSFVIDFPIAKIYLNSELVGEFPWMGEKQDWQDPILIGKDNWRENFHGEMQNIQIFREAISEKSIKEFYENSTFQQTLYEGVLLYHSFNKKKCYFSSGTKCESYNLSYVADSTRGMVAEFNGRNSYIDFGILPVDNAVSISAWVNQNEFNRDYGAIVAFGHAYAFRITTGGALLFTIPQMADVLDSDARIARYKWQHVAVTFKESSGVTFYLNGVKTDFFELEKYQSVPKELQVGTNLWNDFFKGQMDDLIIWNKVLNDEEVKAVFEKHDTYWKANIKTSRKLPWTPIIFTFCVLLILTSVFLVLKRRNKPSVSFEKLNPFQQKIEKVVLSNLSDSNFSVTEFAETMNMSKTKLYNEIKASVGQSPKEYIRQIRINKAARLLKESDTPVTEIIFETGFESRAYFNKCFKGKYKMTPSEYRKSFLI